MTKTTLDQELRSLTAAVQAKYPKPAQGMVCCNKEVWFSRKGKGMCHLCFRHYRKNVA